MCRSVQPVKQQQLGTRKKKEKLTQHFTSITSVRFPRHGDITIVHLAVEHAFFGSGCFSKKVIDSRISRAKTLSPGHSPFDILDIEESILELIPRRHRSTNDGNEAVLGLQRIAIANLSQTCPPFVRSRSFSFSFQQQQRRRHRCVGVKRKSTPNTMIFRIIR